MQQLCELMSTIQLDYI